MDLVPTDTLLCLFLLQKVPDPSAKWKDSAGNWILSRSELVVEVLGDCPVQGNFGTTPATGPLPTRIILYKDVGRQDA